MKFLRVLNKREKIIFYATMGTIISALVFNFVVLPVMARNERLNKEIGRTRFKLIKYLRLLSQKEVLENKYQKLFSDLKLTRTKEDTLVGALSELERLAGSASIKIIDIRPQMNVETQNAEEIAIDLRTEGGIEGYLKFMYDLENSLSLLTVKRMQLLTQPTSQTIEGSFTISQFSGNE